MDKKIYYFQHDATDFVWRDKMTIAELDYFLEHNPTVDLITKELFKIRIQQGWDHEY